MLPGIAGHPRVRITAGADLRREALEKFAVEFEAEVYPDAEGVCGSPNVDAVFIATPHQMHAQHAIMAAECGKHIIVEKPMALTLEVCDAMIQAADRAGVRLLTDRGSSGFNAPVPLQNREGKVIDELLGAIDQDRPVIRDGRWGKATLEVCLAILQSSHEHREVSLSHQTPVPEAAID